MKVRRIEVISTVSLTMVGAFALVAPSARAQDTSNAGNGIEKVYPGTQCQYGLWRRDVPNGPESGAREPVLSYNGVSKGVVAQDTIHYGGGIAYNGTGEFAQAFCPAVRQARDISRAWVSVYDGSAERDSFVTCNVMCSNGHESAFFSSRNTRQLGSDGEDHWTGWQQLEFDQIACGSRLSSYSLECWLPPVDGGGHSPFGHVGQSAVGSYGITEW